ncbi:hypothetical protein PanWU01x14_047670 [Parasponia andersonii]|uniref:Uncharacterized protein n=1 Tax=Parasponia andersonii TaxID=3476 RepID=A0A2P5DN46_PARAD|nr:hypothetical protein PanWU01x14_047670 [Parasponia andersonii]
MANGILPIDLRSVVRWAHTMADSSSNHLPLASYKFFLRVVHGRETEPYIIQLAQFLELSILELCAMIGVDLFQDPESTDYVLPDEVNRVCLINGRIGFSLYPFGEVIRG